MLNAKNRAYLKKLANPLEPSLIIGKGEITDKVLETVNLALEAHELIKVKVLTTQAGTLEETAAALAEKAHAELVQIVGRIIVLYRRKKRIRGLF